MKQDWAESGVEHTAVTAKVFVDSMWNSRAVMAIQGIF